MAFSEDLRLKCDVYERFRIRAETNKLLVITQDKWKVLRQKWQYVTARTRVWQWKLDSSLPGRLGQLGDWLYRAEEMIEQEITSCDQHEDTANSIRSRLDDHKVLNCSK